MDIQTQLLGFDERKRQISSNPDLSDEGKRKQLAALDAETATYKAQVIGDLRGGFDGLKSKARGNIEAIQKAEAEAAKQWDYSRLNYLSQSVRSAIVTAGNFQEVASLYEKARASGDSHTRRVWAELAKEVIQTKYSRDPDAILFAKNLDSDLDQVISTPELRELKAEGTALTNEAQRLDEERNAARVFYRGDSISGVFAPADEFAQVSAGLKINSRVNAETWETITTVELD